jgi:LysR family glycine cleavage system transcriptional activator
MSKVPLHALPGFIAAARLGNLSRAAASLHLTVSALSHQMRGLEDQLHRKLFERTRRGLALTDAGEQLFQAVAPAYDMLELALRPERARSEQSLVLSVMPSVASSWLLPRLATFVAAHPEIELSLQSTTDLVDFDREAVDAAMRFGAGAWPGVRSERLFDEWVVPVASPALLARFPDADRRELSELPLLRDPGDRWREWFARFGGTPPRRYVASFDNTETLQRAAVEGMGVALGRYTMARVLIDRGRLVALSSERLPADYAHYLVYPPRSERHPALLAFRTWLLEAAARYARDIEAPAAPRRPRPPRRPRTRRA